MPHPGLAGLGEIMQIAFVPQDFDATLKHWIDMGAGPFFLLKDNRPEYVAAYGQPCDVALDIALGNWGAMQIEVIRQKGEARTIYSQWRDAGKEGVHHTCIMVPDMGVVRARCAELGLEVVHEGRHGGAEWIYVETGGGDGTLLEVLCMPPGAGSLADLTRRAAQGWDGADPIRALSI